MTALLFPFLVLSGIGLALSIGVHIAALLGVPIPGAELVWGLHLGIFTVWLPAVLVANRASRHAKRRDLWKVALSGCPAWMRIALYGLFAYAIANFIWFVATGTNSGHQHLGDAPPPSIIRGFSGHWMAFYATAFAIMYSALRRPALLVPQECPAGHAVSLSDIYCPTCGQLLAGGKDIR